MMAMTVQARSLPPRKCKYSLHGPSLLCVGLSLLCAGWLLGYGLAQSNGTSTRFALRLMNAPASRPELPSWRGEPTIRSAGYDHLRNAVGETGSNK